MKCMEENALKKLISLFKGDLNQKQDKIITNGILKSNGTVIETAKAGEDYAAVSHTHTMSQITDLQYSPYVISNTAPSNTNLLWIDPENGLKYYNGTEWVSVPVAYT